MSLVAKPPLHPPCLTSKKRKLKCGSATASNKRAKYEPAPSTLRCITNDLDSIPSISEIQRLRRQHTNDLLRDRKLILILDLDNTLLHTVYSKTLTLEEELMLEWQDDVFESWGDSVTKLRPHVRTFLKEASKMYDMYIYTMGGREYARRMAELLDPDGVYFNSKVISQEDCTEPGKKGLDVVLGEERVMVILDDNKLVWDRHPCNLLVIDRYFFFGCDERSKFNDCSLSIKLGELESIHEIFFSSWDVATDSVERDDVRDVILMQEMVRDS